MFLSIVVCTELLNISRAACPPRARRAAASMWAALRRTQSSLRQRSKFHCLFVRRATLEIIQRSNNGELEIIQRSNNARNHTTSCYARILFVICLVAGYCSMGKRKAEDKNANNTNAKKSRKESKPGVKKAASSSHAEALLFGSLNVRCCICFISKID